MSTPKPASRRTRASSAPAPGAAPATVAAPAAEAADLQHEVEVEAYLIAEQRGFAAGQELADWLEAERRISTRHA